MKVLASLRWWIKGVVGEDAYARYLDFHRRSGHAHAPMTEREFWRARMDHQEANPESSCC
jgi:uncharacterized short protein YbdD (DUF466 family)